MNAFEEMDALIDTTAPSWQQRAKTGPRNIVSQLQLSIEDPGVAALLRNYVRAIQPLRDDFKKLDLEIEKLGYTLGRYKNGLPADADEAVKQQGRIVIDQNKLHLFAHGWIAEEIDTAKVLAQPATIVAITWHGARTSDGRELSRESIRQRMRGAAYSDEGWRKYLGTLPPIAEPTEEPPFVRRLPE